MADTKRTCYTCGSKYEYCTRCAKYASQPKWRWMWDTEECKDLYDVVSGYKMGVSSKDDVQHIIEKYNITDFSKYTESIANVLNELCGSVKKNKKKKSMDIDLKEKEEIISDESKEDIKDIKKESTEEIIESILNDDGISNE